MKKHNRNRLIGTKNILPLARLEGGWGDEQKR